MCACVHARACTMDDSYLMVNGIEITFNNVNVRCAHKYPSKNNDKKSVMEHSSNALCVN